MLDTSLPIDGNGVDSGTKVNEICAAIRTLRASLNAGKLDRLGNGTGGVTTDPTTGVVTFTGTSRVYQHVRIAAPSWKIGVAGPTPGYVGIVPVMAFDSAADDSIHYSLITPWRIETGSEIGVVVDWCYTGGADAGTVCWGLEYINIADGEAVAGGTTTTLETTAGTHTTGLMVRTAFTTGIVGAVAHDVIGLRLYRDVSGDTLATDANFIQAHFEFLEDKLGKPI